MHRGKVALVELLYGGNRQVNVRNQDIGGQDFGKSQKKIIGRIQGVIIGAVDIFPGALLEGDDPDGRSQGALRREAECVYFRPGFNGKDAQKLEEAGIDRFLEEYQKQFSAFYGIPNQQCGKKIS